MTDAIHEPAATGPDLDGPVGRLVLVRHGETEWSAARRHTGLTDLPLSARGQAQAGALRPLLATVSPVLVLTSPRQRAIDTAQLAGLKSDGVDDNLSEWDYGAYEGLTTAQIRQDQPDWTIWTGSCPGGETADDVAERCDAILDRVLPYLPQGDVALVAHGHLLRALAARWLGRPVADGSIFALGTGSVSVLGHEYARRVVTRWNVPNPRREPMAASTG